MVSNDCKSGNLVRQYYLFCDAIYSVMNKVKWTPLGSTLLLFVGRLLPKKHHRHTMKLVDRWRQSIQTNLGEDIDVLNPFIEELGW